MGLEDGSGHTHHITHSTHLRIFLSLSNCRCSDLVTWDEDDFYSRGEEDAYNSRDEVTSINFRLSHHPLKVITSTSKKVQIPLTGQPTFISSDKQLMKACKKEGVSLRKISNWHMAHFL